MGAARFGNFLPVAVPPVNEIVFDLWMAVWHTEFVGALHDVEHAIADRLRARFAQHFYKQSSALARSVCMAVLPTAIGARFSNSII